MAEPIDWSKSACLDHPYDLFFPTPAEPLDRAREICAGCPVREACLQEALRTRAGGVRGGLSERERLRMRADVARPDRTADILRLDGKGWSAKQIGGRYGITPEAVWRVLMAHREQQEAMA